VIKMDRTCERQESLGAFLARVRPGDSCACCGATLQSSAQPAEKTRLGCGSSGPRLVAVVCPGVGSRDFRIGRS
jgi:hypothetical protein